MRNTFIILLTSLSLSIFGIVGCSDENPIGDGTNGDGDNGDGDNGDGGNGDGDGDASLVIQAPTFTVAPGQEVTQCYYTTLSNAVELGVNKWTSDMTAGSHHMILFFTDSPLKPDGTLEPDCGFGGGLNQPQWTFSAQDPHTEFQLPTGVGMAVKPNQPVFIQMHYLNASDQPLEANVKISANTFASGESFEQAQPYVTYNTNISIGANQSGSVSGSCDVPSGANFFVMSTHSHHFSTGAQVHDNGNMLVNTTNWEHPESVQWDAPHYQFNGKLNYSCDYFNPTNQTVKTGDSAETDEMCMAVGYFFPGNKPVLCINSFVIP